MDQGLSDKKKTPEFAWESVKSFLSSSINLPEYT